MKKEGREAAAMGGDTTLVAASRGLDLHEATTVGAISTETPQTREESTRVDTVLQALVNHLTIYLCKQK